MLLKLVLGYFVMVWIQKLSFTENVLFLFTNQPEAFSLGARAFVKI